VFGPARRSQGCCHGHYPGISLFLHFNAFWLLPFMETGPDALNYHNYGIEAAKMIRAGAWGSIDWGINTKAMPIIVGLLYAPFGANVYGMLFFSAVLGLGAGLYLCRAFKLLGFPGANENIFLIVLFLALVGIWTSAFGKDSWIAFGLGLTAYGYSRCQRTASSKGIWHLIAAWSDNHGDPPPYRSSHHDFNGCGRISGV